MPIMLPVLLAGLEPAKMKRAPNQPETISVSIYAGIYYESLSRARTLTRCSHSMGTNSGHLTAILQGRFGCGGRAMMTG